MDNDRIDVVDAPLLNEGNSTEVIIEETEGVEPLSIIVWGVGGVLLITLLALLGRIILAKRKIIFDNLEDSPRRSPRRDNVFRIFVDGRELSGYSNPIEPDYPYMLPDYYEPQRSIEQPNSHPLQSQTECNQHSVGQQIYHVRMENFNTYTGSCQGVSGLPSGATRESESDGNDRLESIEQGAIEDLRTRAEVSPRTNSCVNSANASNGRIASLNGYLISPPPYQQVVSSNSRLPTVIVARQQQRAQPRRIDFSL